MCTVYEVRLHCITCRQLLSKGMQLGRPCDEAQERGSICETIASDTKTNYVREELCGTCQPHGCEDPKSGGGSSSAAGGASGGTNGTVETKDATETEA